MLPKWASRFVPTKAEIVAKSVWVVRWSDRRVPRGVRSVLGVPLIIGGILSFLPVLGLWMLPAGAMLIALDIPRLRRPLLSWVDRKEAEMRAVEEASSGEAAKRATPDARGDRAGTEL